MLGSTIAGCLEEVKHSLISFLFIHIYSLLNLFFSKLAYVSCDILCAHVSSEKDSKLVLSISLCQPVSVMASFV